MMTFLAVVGALFLVGPILRLLFIILFVSKK
jgi:hypothetical protein|nr:MAG TPA: hypothetical protein [Caudoviricetes sp.]